MPSTNLIIHRPDSLFCDGDGDVEIEVDGECGPIEPPSRHCPGDEGDVELDDGPFLLVGSARKRGMPVFIDTVLTCGEEDEAEQAIRAVVYDELRGTKQGRRILGSL